ncbi:MAG TPA: hypothetical protein VGR84_00120 [Candidatus Acidoferrales bacterium]|nr:hypothetical protein [Candidatus Acidoferrales bacterium]
MDPFYAEGMVGDVVLKIGQTKKDFEDFFVVSGIAIELALGERVDGMRRIGEKPGEDFFVNETCFDASGAHLIRAFNHHFKEVIETDAVGRQGRKDLFSAAVNIAATSHRVSAFLAREGDG